MRATLLTQPSVNGVWSELSINSLDLEITRVGDHLKCKTFFKPTNMFFSILVELKPWNVFMNPGSRLNYAGYAGLSPVQLHFEDSNVLIIF